MAEKRSPYGLLVGAGTPGLRPVVNSSTSAPSGPAVLFTERLNYLSLSPTHTHKNPVAQKVKVRKLSSPGTRSFLAHFPAAILCLLLFISPGPQRDSDGEMDELGRNEAAENGGSVNTL